jgi:hypothetical protein
MLMREPEFEARTLRLQRGEARHILLIAHPFIGGDENVKCQRCVLEKIAVLQAGPTFLLNGPDDELGQLAPKLPRHVLIQ